MPHHPITTPAGTFSPYTLSILRPLFQRIAMSQRGKCDESNGLRETFDADDFNEVDLFEVNTFDEHSHSQATPAQPCRDQSYTATPAAPTLTEQEIAVAIANGHDPWAEDSDTRRNNRLIRPPIKSMITAGRFAALLTDSETTSAITAPRKCTLIAVIGPFEEQSLDEEINNTLKWLADIALPSPKAWRGIEVVALETSGYDLETMQNRLIEGAVKSGRKIIAFLPSRVAVPNLLRAVSDLSRTFPPITKELCIELLRATHSATGQLAEDQLRNLLPSDAEIANLPLAVIERAFSAQTTIAVAQELANAVQRLQKKSKRTLNDIVLNSSIQAPVDQLVADILAWKSGKLHWAEISSSILLHGPPGNGKTMLASALAGTLGTRLVATSYSDCQKYGHQGKMLAALANKVDKAVLHAPCVFFLDELDSFTHRDSETRNNDYIVGVVNGLLEHLSFLNNTAGVIVLAATNHLKMIDQAVVRAGRFDRHIEVGDPNLESIVRIIEQAVGETTRPLNLRPIAEQLLGSTGATVVALVQQARGLARGEEKTLEQCHLEAAAASIAPPVDHEILWRTAVHEAGHLVVASALQLPAPTGAKLTKNGGLVNIPASAFETLETARNRIATLFGGFAAELYIFGNASSGAGEGPESDLANATALADKICYHWGLEKRLAHRPVQRIMQGTDSTVEPVLRNCLQRASRALEANADVLKAIATALMSERELSGEQCRQLLANIGEEETRVECMTRTG